ncbi:hypothetical protein B296_00032150 [Ensete ventricosum]|uniref:LOB domain-containing protein n=1 Tax=Ensete ventricosum TaxID=4639 RepID=A0A426ZXX6_ENSVE|nr:hypothetical protein B296_00032150 [Ensete ventricosum]
MGSHSPCASCKLLRRRCTPDCVFAPFFPSDEPHTFATVHRVFGASNVSKMLQVSSSSSSLVFYFLSTGSLGWLTAGASSSSKSGCSEQLGLRSKRKDEGSGLWLRRSHLSPPASSVSAPDAAGHDEECLVPSIFLAVTSPTSVDEERMGRGRREGRRFLSRTPHKRFVVAQRRSTVWELADASVACTGTKGITTAVEDGGRRCGGHEPWRAQPHVLRKILSAPKGVSAHHRMRCLLCSTSQKL